MHINLEHTYTVPCFDRFIPAHSLHNMSSIKVQQSHDITKTCLYNFDPLKPHFYIVKKGKRKVQGVPQLQTAALPRPQEEEETDKSKQAQIEQTYEKH